MNHAVPASSAWQALALIARFHQLPCSVPALQHRFGAQPQPGDLLRAKIRDTHKLLSPCMVYLLQQ